MALSALASYVPAFSFESMSFGSLSMVNVTSLTSGLRIWSVDCFQYLFLVKFTDLFWV